MKIFLLFILLLVSYNAPAQNPEWEIIKPTNTGIQGNLVYSVTFEGDDLWVAGFDQWFDEGGAAVFTEFIGKTIPVLMAICLRFR